MERIRVLIGSSWFLASALGVTLFGGCGDESRQTGTQVKESEQERAVVDSMQDDMLKQNKERSGGR